MKISGWIAMVLASTIGGLALSGAFDILSAGYFIVLSLLMARLVACLALALFRSRSIPEGPGILLGMCFGALGALGAALVPLIGWTL